MEIDLKNTALSIKQINISRHLCLSFLACLNQWAVRGVVGVVDVLGHRTGQKIRAPDTKQSDDRLSMSRSATLTDRPINIAFIRLLYTTSRHNYIQGAVDAKYYTDDS